MLPENVPRVYPRSFDTSAVSTAQLSLKFGSASIFDQRSLIACLPWTHLPSFPDTYASSAMKLMNWSTFLEPAACAQSWSTFFRSSVGLAATARNAAKTTNSTAASPLRIVHLLPEIKAQDVGGKRLCHLSKLTHPALLIGLVQNLQIPYSSPVRRKT